MSKTAEQKANEVFPLPPLYNEEQRKSLGYAQVYTRVKDQQEGYIKGYDQALQDFMDNEINHVKSVVVDNGIITITLAIKRI